MKATWAMAAATACLMGGCAGGVGLVTLPGEFRTAERQVDYRKEGLQQPPDGYAWYSYAGEYVLAARLSGRVKASLPAS